MEHYFYLAVKIAAAEYILYKVWLLLFRDRLFGLWDRIPVREPRTKTGTKSTAPVRKNIVHVVGRAQGSYIEDPAPPMPPVPVIPVVPEVAGGGNDIQEDQGEQFEVGPSIERPSDAELYGAGNEQPQVTDFSTGWTYEQLTDAVSFAAAPVNDEQRMVRAAETFMLLRGSDLFDVIQRDIGNAGSVDRVIAECFDPDGNRLPRRKSGFTARQLAAFDAGDYI
jgi:hypothetical protein